MQAEIIIKRMTGYSVSQVVIIDIIEDIVQIELQQLADGMRPIDAGCQGIANAQTSVLIIDKNRAVFPLIIHDKGCHRIGFPVITQYGTVLIQRAPGRTECPRE